ncbi:L-2-hydroxyglutarate oxidase [Bacteroidia bacterium]|nr:L-2-hydroxyglutarate oxidase [Bacteroidia bacterium]MDB9881928.1 L-2-hydroxyglutarate oxidase [Bacteroidia bacterium]MDC1394881.1 L-2-hydroxyglutarate oxidase [Bacteroidia bacterium]
MNADIAIVGGGIVGLATAYHLTLKYTDKKIVVLEKESEIAHHQTGNNSGVIHSGLYYKPGSLKAKNCIDGYHMLLEFCDENNISYDLCGKVVVATEKSELGRLRDLYDRGRENGLEGLEMLGQARLREIEPHLAGIQGIRVPQTGIVNYVDICNKLAEKIEQNGGEIHLNTVVKSIEEKDDEVQIVTNKSFVECQMMVNCAGLYSDSVAKMHLGDIDTRIIPFRGEYYELTAEAEHLVKHLIYPVPDPAFPFLGVHYTRMIGGGIEAGPNAVFAFRKEGYKRTDFDFKEFFGSLMWPGFQKVMLKYWKTGLGEMYRSFSKKSFTKALQRLIPEIKEEDLVAAPAGVRAQACDRTGGLLDDFKLVTEKRAIHVINAPSPAATSSLSIGKTIAGMVDL